MHIPFTVMIAASKLMFPAMSSVVVVLSLAAVQIVSNISECGPSAPIIFWFPIIYEIIQIKLGSSIDRFDGPRQPDNPQRYIA